MGDTLWFNLVDPISQFLGSIMDHIYIQNGKIVRHGTLSFTKETIDGTQGGGTYKLHQEEIHTKLFKPPANSDAQCTPRSYWEADIRPKRLLFRRDNGQERLVLETAQRLQPDSL